MFVCFSVWMNNYVYRLCLCRVGGFFLYVELFFVGGVAGAVGVGVVVVEILSCNFVCTECLFHTDIS